MFLQIWIIIILQYQFTDHANSSFDGEDGACPCAQSNYKSLSKPIQAVSNSFRSAFSQEI